MARLRPTPSGHDAWVDLAERRIISVLTTRIAANIRQLEVKISEAGPDNIRAEPHYLTYALKRLKRSGIIVPIKPPGERQEEATFFTLATNYPQPARSRVEDLLFPYRMHRWLAGTRDYCAHVLEVIVEQSFDAAGGYKYRGKPPKSTPLDGAYEIGTEKIGMEAKNVREWVYPTSREIWMMVKKCLTINAIPLLVTRKTSYIARATMDKLGIMYFETFRQFFSLRTANYLIDIQHTDKLGYKDVIAVGTTPNPFLVNYLQNTLPAQIAEYRTRWDAMHDFLEEFARRRGFGDADTKDEERTKHHDEMLDRLGLVHNGPGPEGGT
jgi:hypothetical protein